MTIKEVIEILNEKFPENLAIMGDYTGFQIGNMENKLSGIVISLDLTFGAIETAIHTGNNLIITHHPMFYSANLNSIDLNSILGKKIELLIKNDITVYSMHTNVDAARDGLNDYLIDGLFDDYIFEVLKPINLLKASIEESGIGRIVYLKEPISREDLIKRIKERLETNYVRFIGRKDSYKKIAFCSGSGSSLISDAKDCDVYITGDITYHTALQAYEEGLDIIDIEHDTTEKYFVSVIGDYLREMEILAKISYYREPPLYKLC